MTQWVDDARFECEHEQNGGHNGQQVHRVVTTVDSGNTKLNQVEQFKHVGVSLSDRGALEKAVRAIIVNTA